MSTDTVSTITQTDSSTPLLGHIVFLSVRETTVDPRGLHTELFRHNVTTVKAPKGVAPADAFRSVCSKNLATVQNNCTLLLRNVKSGAGLVRQVVIEEGGTDNSRLTHTDLGTIEYVPLDSSRAAEVDIDFNPNRAYLPLESRESNPHEIAARSLYTLVRSEYIALAGRVDSPRMRLMFKSALVSECNAMPIKRSVWFVHEQNAPGLKRLRDLASTSLLSDMVSLDVIPIADVTEMRNMVVRAWREAGSQPFVSLLEEAVTTQQRLKSGVAVRESTVSNMMERYRAAVANAREHMALLQQDDAAIKNSAELVRATLTSLHAQV